MSGLRQVTSGDSPTRTARSRWHLTARKGDPEPRWQTLGKMNLAKGTIAQGRGGSRMSRSTRAHRPDDRQSPRRRQRATLAGARAGAALAFVARRLEQGIAARIDSRAHRDDRRDRRYPPNTRSHELARSRFSGAGDRTSLARPGRFISASRCWSRSGSGRCFPKRRSTPRSTASSIATITRSKRSFSRRFPASRSAATSTGPANQCGRVPAILCPHGHWEDGRMNPEVQQRCIRWAKLGCIVFMYDMVGYNDSKPFTHAFLNDRLRRWGLSLPTLQTWNSIRALDWLDLAARRRPGPHRLHGRIGRGNADVPAHGPGRAHQGVGAGGHGLRHIPGRLRLRERRRACGSAPTTSSSPPFVPRDR